MCACVHDGREMREDLHRPSSLTRLMALDSGSEWYPTMHVGMPPKIADATIAELLEQLKRPEGRIRAWIRRELRERERLDVHIIYVILMAAGLAGGMCAVGRGL